MRVIQSFIFVIVAVACGGCSRDVITVPTVLGPLSVEGDVLFGEHFVTKRGVIPLVGIVADGPSDLLDGLAMDELWPSEITMRICSPRNGLIVETHMIVGQPDDDEVRWHEPSRALLLTWGFSAFGDNGEFERAVRRVVSGEEINIVDILMKEGSVYSVEIRGRFNNQPPPHVRYSLYWYHREERRVFKPWA